MGYNFEIEKIHDTVWVFKKAIKNPEEFVDYFEKNKEWKDWYTFGKMALASIFDPIDFQSFPSQEEWQQKILDSSSQLGDIENKINDLFYNATKLYIDENKINYDSWTFKQWNIAKYEEKPDDQYAMMYHTDYQREFSYNPGNKFGVTSVAYLNDNYTGGEVVFRFLDDKDSSVIKEDYSYKPQAGDILVFRSGPPHYHGVKAITKGEKYILRLYWMYDYAGHPLWLALQKKYGKDVWDQMEEARLKYNRNKDNIKVLNNIPFYDEFEDYYSKEIAGLHS